jgi:hypothetical protein
MIKDVDFHAGIIAELWMQIPRPKGEGGPKGRVRDEEMLTKFILKKRTD